MRKPLAIVGGVIAASAGLALLASVALVVESGRFSVFLALLALALALSAAYLGGRRGLRPVAVLVAGFLLISGSLAAEWHRSDDGPGAGFGAAIAAALSLLLLAGGVLGAAVNRFRGTARPAACGGDARRRRAESK